MKRFFKWIGIILGSIVGLLIAAGLVLNFLAEARMNKVYEVAASNIVLPTDPESIENGKHRAETLCEGCHGPDLGGINKWFNNPGLGTIDSANLTAGEGGVGREYTSAEDYVRAIRHGIDREGKAIFMVAVVSTAHLSDDDLGAIIAYLKTIPPVDRKTNGANFTPLAKILYSVGILGKMPAETVSHEVGLSAPEKGVSAEYGEYLVKNYDCQLCHGQELAGGKHPDPTIKKISPNLTPGGEVGFWSEEQFIQTLRTGVTPSGHNLDPILMPWDFYRNFYDEELKAIFAYLKSLPKLPQFSG